MKYNKFTLVIVMLLTKHFVMGQSAYNHVLFNKQYLAAVASDDYNLKDAGHIFDGNYTAGANNSSTGSTWLQVNTKCVKAIHLINIYPALSGEYYIFLSKAPFNHFRIETLLQDPAVTYFNWSSGDGSGSGMTSIPTGGFYGQYILVVSGSQTSRVNISEMDIYGEKADCTYYPTIDPPIIGPPVLPPYGDCTVPDPISPLRVPPYLIGIPFQCTGVVNPWWSNGEICGDGIDNDNNGLKDCEDYPCRIGWFNTVKDDPTCAICDDGSICVFSGSHIKEVSMDDGQTWMNFPRTGYYCFDNVEDGIHKIRLRSFNGCEEGKEVTLSAPVGGEEICENGGFEQGNFNNWTAGVSTVYSNTFTDADFPRPQFNIFGSGYKDPYAPFITGADGIFFARLGTGTGGNNSQRMTYCMTVDNDNSVFKFNWAAVVQLPDAGHKSGYFQYRIYDKATNFNIFVSDRTTAQSPYLNVVGLNIFAIGWTCEQFDLSSFMGREVCVEFITSNCQENGHFAYAYIDALCQSGEYAPDVTIKTNDIYCTGQPIDVDGLGNGFQQYNWVISTLDENGNETESITTPIITSPFVHPIPDLAEYYIANGGTAFNCTNNIKLQLNVYSGSSCGSHSVDKTIRLDCASYNIDYCDPFYYCISANQNIIHIQGVNDCDDCTYAWNSKQGVNGLFGMNAKFPYLDRSAVSNAFDKRYFVNIETLEGCKYYDEFEAISNPFDIVIKEIDYGYCAYKVYVDLIFDFDINGDEVAIEVTNLINNSKIPVHVSGISNRFSFDFGVLRDGLSQMKIEVKYADDNCFIGNCSKSVTLDRVNAPSNSQWKFFYPFIFYPDGGGYPKSFFGFFRSVKENKTDCNDLASKSSVYFYRLRIYDSLGNLAFDESVNTDLFDTKGILGPEIEWDGTFNGQPVESGVYAWTVTVESCDDGSNHCTDCGGPNNEWRVCGSPGQVIFAGDVTVAR